MKLVLPIIGEPLPSDVLKALLQGREDLPPAVGGSQVCYDFLYLKVEASRYVMVFVSKIGCTQVCYDFCILMWGQPVMFVSKLLP